MVGVPPVGGTTFVEAAASLGTDRGLWMLAALVLAPLVLYSFRKALSE
jgi:hypothetical protein